MSPLENNWMNVALQSIATINSGDPVTAKDFVADGRFPVFGGNGVRGYITSYNNSVDRVVVGRVGARCGNVHIAKAPFWASEHALVINPHTKADLRWLAACLIHADLGQLSMSSAQPVITATNVGMIKVPFPPFETQRAIADYLDRETAEIDAMTADLDKMEKLLTERLSAIIDSAFATRPGTDTVRVGYFAELITGLTYSPADIVQEGGTVVLRSGNIQNSKVSRENDIAVDMDIPARLRVRDGDILVCARNGSADLVGKSARLTANEEGLTWGAFMTVVRSEYSDWLYWFLRSSEFSRLKGDFSSSTINQLTNSTFARIPVQVERDSNKRCEIVERLDRETAEIDSMLADITELRDLLAERRAALIAAAVTGQINIPAAKEPTHA